MKVQRLRLAVTVGIFAVLCIGLVVGLKLGTFSGFSLGSFAALCPVGAFTTMLASRTFIPRAVFSIIGLLVLVLVFGRFFCGWMCPVPVIQRIRNFFRKPATRRSISAAKRAEIDRAIAADPVLGRGTTDGSIQVSAEAKTGSAAKLLAHNCGACATPCGTHKRGTFDTRHGILGLGLLSTAAFGFPVFCLICPVGLTTATVVVIFRAFSVGDVTWSLVIIPAILLFEVLFLRKWCSRFCPLSGLMNLVSRFSRTTKPVIDEAKCLEAQGNACSACAEACEFDINLRHPDFGERDLADCTRCRACVDACPTQAVHMPFLTPRQQRKAS